MAAVINYWHFNRPLFLFLSIFAQLGSACWQGWDDKLYLCQNRTRETGLFCKWPASWESVVRKSFFPRQPLLWKHEHLKENKAWNPHLVTQCTHTVGSQWEHVEGRSRCRRAHRGWGTSRPRENCSPQSLNARALTRPGKGTVQRRPRGRPRFCAVCSSPVHTSRRSRCDPSVTFPSRDIEALCSSVLWFPWTRMGLLVNEASILGGNKKGNW